MSDGGIEQELSTLDLGDRRLDRRARAVVSRLFESPQRSPKAAMRGAAEMMGAYRLFDHEECSDKAILGAHRAQVLERVREQARVLVIQDTTELDYTGRRALAGSGPLSIEERQGFFLHTQWVVSDQRLPLGTWQARIHARQASEGKKDPQRRKHLPLEEKESFRWLEGYRSACDLAAQAPGVQVISCGDRENDIYEVFAEWHERRQEGRVAAEWVIRCSQNRCVLEDGQEETPGDGVGAHLIARVARSPVLGGVRFFLKSKVQTRKVKGGNPKKVHRQGRTVRQEIRAGEITLRAPYRPGARLPEVTLRVVMASEIDPPPGQDPVTWVLLTSLPVGDLNQALEVLQFYLARWEIEEFHRVLKTGCRVERLQFQDAQRLKPALALYLIVAWRILYLTKLGRACPSVPCDAVFEPSEWQSLWVVVRREPLPAKPPSLQEVILMIAQLGGYTGRKGDGPPGAQAMWEGLQAVRHFAMAWEAFGPNNTS